MCFLASSHGASLDIFLAMANASHLVVAARRRGHSFHNLAALYTMLSLVLLGTGISPLAFDLIDLASLSWMILLLPKMALPRRLRSASPPSLLWNAFQVSMAVDLTDTWLREGIPASCRSLSTNSTTFKSLIVLRNGPHDHSPEAGQLPFQ
jgi:hypothetical protein